MRVPSPLGVIATSLALAVTASPAAAQPAAGQLEDTADLLSDEAAQDRLARSIAAIGRVLMAVPVGPLAEAVREVDPDSDLGDLPADARLGDLAGEDADDMPDRLASQSRVMMRSMGVLARQLAVMAPVLRDMASDMSAQMERELSEPPRRR